MGTLPVALCELNGNTFVVQTGADFILVDRFSTNKVYSMKSSDSPSKQLDTEHLENGHNASGRA
jgi:hypothetical protein